MPEQDRTIAIDVLRYDPQHDKAPSTQRFEVPFTEQTSVLEALQHIKDHMDGSLSFRWSCRMAICGSCGMMINGEPALSCSAFVRDYFPGVIRIEPLAHFPVVRDLVIDQSDFLGKLKQVKPYLIRGESRSPADGTHLQTPRQRERYAQFSDCINCLLCYSACPQYGLDDSFTGPGALALLHRYNSDSRDQGKRERMEVVNAQSGVWGCTLVGHCSTVCPKQVDPAAAVNRNKINSTLDYFARFVKPRDGGQS